MQTLLTTKFIEGYSSKGKLERISDSKSPNLVLVVTPAGSKAWAWRGRIDGKMKQKGLGPFPMHSLNAARTWADNITTGRDEGVDVMADPTKDATREEWLASLTCDKLFDIYLEHGAADLRSKDEKVRIYNRDIKPVIGAKLVRDVDHDMLMGIIRAKLKTAPAMSNGLESFLSAWFGWAVSGRGSDVTKLVENPAARLSKLYKIASRQRSLDEYEIGMLFKALPETKSSMAEPTYFILHLGLRRNEVFEAKWSEFDLDKGEWLIPGERMKNKLPHMVPLTDGLVDILKARRAVQIAKAVEKDMQPVTHVWPSRMGSRDNPMSGFSDWMGLLIEKMQWFANKDGRVIDKWSLHDLRRTFSSKLNSMRRNKRRLVDSEIVERCLAHKQGGVKGVYDKYDYFEEKKDAIEVWAGFLQSIKDLHGVPANPLLAAPVLQLPAPGNDEASVAAA